jgi:23S rRNA (cytidine1920-2'-O)/16S rRNA (cytidine1409-2'-O)-methyltransferase
MVRRGLVTSREQARREIEAGRVLVDGSFAAKPARMVDPAQSVTIAGPRPRFVSRAGEKLAGALDRFDLNPDGLACLDAGSSTGGFTDCLLQRGAASVLAVDVGTNQLHERIRNDRRVEVREQTDVRTLSLAMFDRPFDLVVGDLSFISLKLVLPTLISLVVDDGGPLLLLVKPQFEAGRAEASKGRGVITDPAVWRRVLGEVVTFADEAGAGLAGAAPSSITGTSGNVEFVTWLRRGRPSMPGSEGVLDGVVEQAEGR